MARADYWNHNVHYQPVILRAVPPGCGAALEVGCGDGLLASKLAGRCAEVTAIDRDARMIALARSRAQAAGPGRMTVVEAEHSPLTVTGNVLNWPNRFSSASGREPESRKYIVMDPR